MGLLPLRLPPKPQPCEGYQTLCAALPLIVFLGSPFRRTRGSLSALHTNHPFVLQGVCPAGVGPGGQTVFILFQVDGQLAEKAALLRRAAGEQAVLGVRFALHASALALRGVAGLF